MSIILQDIVNEMQTGYTITKNKAVYFCSAMICRSRGLTGKCRIILPFFMSLSLSKPRCCIGSSSWGLTR